MILSTTKMQNFVVTTLMKARDIPDFNVTLNVLPKNHALVTSSKHRHIVYNLAGKWAGWNCVWALRENICKHVFMIMLLLQADIAKDTIANLCGKHVGTVIGGMSKLLTPST